MAPVTRTTRFEVQFANLRSADRERQYARIWGTMDDATVAMNRISNVFWLLHEAMLPPQMEGPRTRPKMYAQRLRDLGFTDDAIDTMSIEDMYRAIKGPNGADPKAWGYRDVAYRMFNGEYQPGGKRAYSPSAGAGRLSGNAMSEISSWVETRITTDGRDISRGKQVLSTFHRTPLGVTNQAITFRDDGVVELGLFAKDDPTGGTRVALRPVGRIDSTRKKILRGLQDKSIKVGCAKLNWHQPKNRKGKWYLAISYTTANAARFDAPAPREATIAAGIDIGIRWTSMIAFVDANTGVYEKRYECVQLPRHVRAAWEAVDRERRERSTFNRDVYDMRTGRGREGKLRVVRCIGDRLSRLVDTALDCHVAAVVRTVKARGATICSIEDHAHWSVGRAHDRAEDEGGTNAGKAKMRHDYFRWHQGALRSKLESVLAREGIEVRIVDPAMTSRTCPDCGKVWAETGVYAPKGVAPGPFGRISLEQFVCECGCSKQADFCAGIEIARRWEAGLTPAEVDAANKAHVSTATARAAKAAKLSIQEWKTANPKKNNRKGSTSKNTSDTLNV